jgi:hypothetical protein
MQTLAEGGSKLGCTSREHHGGNFFTTGMA